MCVKTKKTRKERHRPRGRKLPTSGTILRLVALLKRSSGGRALFMTLNVNMNVENSIKNIYMSADSAAVQVFAVKAHLQFLFCFHDNSENTWSQKHLYCPLVFFFPYTCPFPTTRLKTILIFGNIFRGTSSHFMGIL